MTKPRLNKDERRVLFAIPNLAPDEMADDLDLPGMNAEAISYAIQHLERAKLIWANVIDTRHPFAPDFGFIGLTFQGEELVRDLRRPWIVRKLEIEWKWLITTFGTAVSLGLSLWNFFHPTH